MVEHIEEVDRVQPLTLPRGIGRRQRRRLIRGLLLTSDAIALAIATLGGTLLRFTVLSAAGGFESTLKGVSYRDLSLVLSLVWLVCLGFEHLYDLDRVFWGSGEFSRVVRGLAVGIVGFILVTFAVKIVDLSRLWLLLSFGLAVLLTTGGRLAVRGLLRHVRRHDRLLRPALIVGSNAEADDLLRVLSADRATGIRPIGCLASSRAERLALNFCASVPCLGAARDVAPIVREFGIDTVVIASSAFDHDILARIVSELRDLDVDVQVSSGLFEVLTSRILVREISGVPLITVKGVSLSRVNLLTKRAFDVTVSMAVVVLGSPLWAVLAALIKLNSPGPVFYGQERIGKGGVPFQMLKFRSMVADADTRLRELGGENEADGPLFKMKDDPRVTPIGRWMRKFSVDEFPQLVNVLRGEMSLVGPRPPLPVEVDRYSEQAWRRLEVVPGMTGLWQVSGRSNLTFDEMVRLDLFYIENWSVSLDLGLIMRTVPAVVAARGAY